MLISGACWRMTPEVMLTHAELDEAFDLRRSLRNVDAVFEALAAIG